MRNNNEMLSVEILGPLQKPPPSAADLNYIWGKVAAAAIPKGTMLTKSMFDVPSNPARVYVYFARLRIPRHTSGAMMLQKAMVVLKRLPYYLVEPDAVTSKTKLTNYVVLHQVTKGTQLLKSELAFSTVPVTSPGK